MTETLSDYSLAAERLRHAQNHSLCHYCAEQAALLAEAAEALDRSERNAERWLALEEKNRFENPVLSGLPTFVKESKEFEYYTRLRAEGKSNEEAERIVREGVPAAPTAAAPAERPRIVDLGVLQTLHQTVTVVKDLREFRPLRGLFGP